MLKMHMFLSLLQFYNSDPNLKIWIDFSLSYLGTIYLSIVLQIGFIRCKIKFPSLSSSCIIWVSAAHFKLNFRINVSLLYQILRHNVADFLPNKLNYNNKTFNNVPENRKSKVLILFVFLLTGETQARNINV